MIFRNLRLIIPFSKHFCNGVDDPFVYIRKQIGTSKSISMTMGIFKLLVIFIVDGIPTITEEGYKVGECIWDYDVMGLISIGKSVETMNNQ